MSHIEKKLDSMITEIKGLKEILENQTHVLESMVDIFTKYDQELLLEDDELRQG